MAWVWFSGLWFPALFQPVPQVINPTTPPARGSLSVRFHSTTSFGQSLGARSRSRSKKLGCGAQLKYVYHQSERHGYLYNLLPTVLGNIKNSLTGSTQSHRPVERRMEAKGSCCSFFDFLSFRKRVEKDNSRKSLELLAYKDEEISEHIEWNVMI